MKYKLMTLEEYQKWYPEMQAKAKGIQIHAFNTQIGYVRSAIYLLDMFSKKPEKYAHKVQWYEDLYDRARTEIDNLLKQQAMGSLPLKYQRK